MPRLLPGSIAVALVASVLSVSTPRVVSAQACPSGAALYYNSLPGCSIGSVSLVFTHWNIGDPNVIFTPLSGTDVNGTYFGFSLKSALGGAFFTNSYTGTFDPSDPTHLLQDGTTTGLFWAFTHSLPGPKAIFRTAITTSNSVASTVSQPMVGPTMVDVVDPADPTIVLGVNPDVNSGCGWSGIAGYDGTLYSAANLCGYLTATSNNWVWDQATASFSGISWSVSGSSGSIYGTGDFPTQQCWQGTAGLVLYSGSTCNSYHDLNGFDLGSAISGGVITTGASMDNTDTIGWVDPNGPGISADASIDYYETRLYYVPTTSTPEPATLVLVATGLGLVAGVTRRRRAR